MANKKLVTIGACIDKFLSNKRANSKPATYNLYAHFLLEFRARHGELAADAVTSMVLRSWIDTKYRDNSQSTKRMAARSVLAVLHHAYCEHIIDRKPIRGFRKPADGRREVVLSPPQYALLLRTSRGAIRTAIKFLWHTGCRPAEFRALHSGWIRGRKIVLPDEVAKTKRRNLYLDNMAYGMVAGRSGVLFHNNDGRPWTDSGLVYQFRVLRKATGIDGLVPYTLRHTWITRLLERGIDAATVAELARTSPRMILDVYNHVAKNENRLLSLLD